MPPHIHAPVQDSKHQNARAHLPIVNRVRAVFGAAQAVLDKGVIRPKAGIIRDKGQFGGQLICIAVCLLHPKRGNAKQLNFDQILFGSAGKINRPH